MGAALLLVAAAVMFWFFSRETQIPKPAQTPVVPVCIGDA
jgi:hypothetical protein